ncbi:MAG: hypothetical protein PVH52_04020 [bacterium]|jgi:hypothetical protein
MKYPVAFMVLIFAVTLLGPTITSSILKSPTHVVYAGTEKILKKSDQKTEKPAEETKKFITSKHERKVERRNNWIEGLEGDKARIYELYGYPSGKYREEVMGAVIERWVYPEHGVTFKFKGNKLTR